MKRPVKTSLGAVLRTYEAPSILGEGVMLHIRMSDHRTCQVFLTAEDRKNLIEMLQDEDKGTNVRK